VAPGFFNWHPETLYERLQPLAARLGWGPVVVEAVVETGSTNTDLLAQARRGDTQPCVRVATRQTAGRGRRGRTWHSAPSEPGASLAFSVGLPIDLAQRDPGTEGGSPWSGLSLAVGVALAEALDPSGQALVQLKWPNDLWRQGRKLGGILIESAQGYAVVGVGLNIARDPPIPLAELGTGYASVAELPRPPNHAAVADTAALAVAAWHLSAMAVLGAVAQLRDEGFAHGFAQRFAARDLLQGQAVTVSGPPELAGTACGVDGTGALLVHTAAGMQTVHSSEVSVRPASPPGLPPQHA
jgi:BirA family biotin operon repressor/biotin-[acetyl-CoA-carboxylase] ligase